MTYEEYPLEIKDLKVQKLRIKKVELMKVIWRKNAIEEAIWELENEM